MRGIAQAQVPTDESVQQPGGLPPTGAATGDASMPPSQAIGQAKWSCQTVALDAEGKPGGELTEAVTVGQKFLLRCEGEPVDLKRDALRLELPKEQRFALRILETKQLSETSGEFVATTWVATNADLKDVVLTDGSARVNLGEIKTQAVTVITPENNPENKPFPPWSVQALAWPLYMWVGIAILLALLGLALGLAIYKRIQRKRLLKELEKNATALTPYNQFNKDLRKLARQIGAWSLQESRQFFLDMDQAFRWFLARELVIQALRSRPGAIVKEVKRVNPTLYKEVRKDLHLALSELDKAIRDQKPASADDANQLADLCRKLADQITKKRSA